MRLSFVVAAAVHRTARSMSEQRKCDVMGSSSLYTGRLRVCGHLWCAAGNPSHNERVAKRKKGFR